MSMRSQIYAWNSQSTSGGTTAWDDSATGQTGNSVSIFIGGFGNNITKPAETTATQFVVIEDVAVSPSPHSWFRVSQAHLEQFIVA